MTRTFAIAATLAWVMMTGVAVSGQPAASAARQTSAGLLGDQQLVEGTIKSVDTQTIVLDDGTALIVPASSEFNRTELKPGAGVKAQYEEGAGKKFTTTVILEPASRRR
jgi:hypothetical protein